MESPKLFTDDELNALKKIATAINFPANTIVVNQGEYGEQFYYILNGELEVYIINNLGEKIPITHLKDGEYFGELAPLAENVRTATVKTITACQLLMVEKKEFNNFINDHPNFCIRLLKIIGGRLAKTLTLFSEKNKRVLIELIYNDETEDLVRNLEEYFLKISPLKVVKTTNENYNKDISKYNDNKDNFYILIRRHIKTENKQFKADHIVNFADRNDGHYLLNSRPTQWQIENIARKITKKTIGIALASGGAPGMAHIGVLNEFKKENIPIDFIAGTSAGALYGAVFSFGLSFDAILNILQKEVHKPKLFLILKNLCFNFSGLMSNKHLKSMLQPIFSGTNIEDALIPFAAVSSDLYTGETIIIKNGETIKALLASNAAPLIVEPFKYGDYLLVDGVATAPLPVRALYEEKLDLKVAVSIPQLDLIVSRNENPKLMNVYLRSRSMMANQMVLSESSLSDILIQPKVEGARLIDWKNMDLYINAGKEAATPAIKKIRQFLKSPWYSE